LISVSLVPRPHSNIFMSQTLTAPSRATIRELKIVCRKGKLDPIWISNIFWRPVSIYFTWIFVRLRISANQITFISCIFAIASSFILLRPSWHGYVSSVVMMQIYYLLDHVDGEVARYQHMKGQRSTSTIDLSGVYFDHLVHYFQGPSFYFCLSAGIAYLQHNLLWVIPGVAAAFGCSGFPRLMAVHKVLSLISSTRSQSQIDFAARLIDYDPFGESEQKPTKLFIIPRSKREFAIAVRQYIVFPGNFFVFAAAVALDILLVPNESFPFLKLFLIFYAFIGFITVTFTTRKYMFLLSQVPR
jgi:hypothetical protein